MQEYSRLQSEKAENYTQALRERNWHVVPRKITLV